MVKFTHGRTGSHDAEWKEQRSKLEEFSFWTLAVVNRGSIGTEETYEPKLGRQRGREV